MSEKPEGTFSAEEERQLFIQYAATMLYVQSFEWSLKRLSSLYTDVGEEPTFDRALRAVQNALSTAVGPLIQQLKKYDSVPEQLLKELDRARNNRNYLAHEYLFEYVLKKSWGMVANPAQSVNDLQSQAHYFQSLHEVLYKLICEREQNLGIDHILDSDIGHLIEKILHEKMREGESEEA